MLVDDDLLFRFFLAHQLRRTLADIDGMTVAEFTGWQAYFDTITPTAES